MLYLGASTSKLYDRRFSYQAIEIDFVSACLSLRQGLNLHELTGPNDLGCGRRLFSLKL